MNKSLWIEESEKTDFPQLLKDENADVCVIGGGITGVVTAYLLAQKGKKVILLEKNRVGMGVTAYSTAKLTSQHGLFYKYLKDKNGEEFAKRYLEANEKGISLAREIIKKENINCDYEVKDAYVFATDKSELEKVNEEVNVLKKIGFDAEFVNSINIPAKNVLGAIKFKNQAQFNSRKYIVELIKAVSNLGVKIFENSKVVNIKSGKNSYMVSTEKSVVFAKDVVIATHYPIKNFPGIYFAKMYQDKSYVIAVDLKDEKNKYNIDGMYLQSHDPVISFRTAKYMDRELLVVAGSGHKTGKPNGIIEDSFTNLENYIKKYYPNCETVFRWSTEDCVTLDKVPYIGRFSNFLLNVYVATGFKKWGMSTSHVAAKIIADLIIDGKSEYEDIFRANRFEPIKNIKELGNIIKESSYSLVINKIRHLDVKFNEIKLGDGGIIEIDGEKIGIYKRIDGKIFAVKPVCKHLGCLLSWNNLEKTWDCPCHGSRYDYEGNILTEPTVRGLDKVDVIDEDSEV